MNVVFMAHSISYRRPRVNYGKRLAEDGSPHHGRVALLRDRAYKTGGAQLVATEQAVAVKCDPLAWGAAILAARPSQVPGQRKMMLKPTPLTWMAPEPEMCAGRFAAV